jgi:hypothetical protein
MSSGEEKIYDFFWRHTWARWALGIAFVGALAIFGYLFPYI